MVDQEVYHTVTDVATNITIPEIDPILSGFEFDGWYLDEDYTRIFSTTELKKEKQTTVDVYAKFLRLYTLSFETNGGEKLDPISIATAASSFSATRSGYVLCGWYYDAGFIEKVEFPLVLDKDTTIYARWANESSVINYYLDQELYHTETIANDAEPTLPYPDKLLGHTFSGWKTSQGDTYEYDGVIYDSFDLYGTHTPNTYTIFFDYKDAPATVLSASITYGDTFSNLPSPSIEGYDFKGWYYGSTPIISGTTRYNYECNVTLTAEFTIKEFVMKFYDADSNEMTAYKYNVPYGTNINDVVFPSVTSLTGYNYEWLINDTTKIVSNTKIKSNYAFYLNYSPMKFIITYDYGNNVTDRDYIYYDEIIDLPSVERYGYIFTGWYYNDDLITDNTKYNYVVNITLTAHYDLDTFTVSFYDDNDNLYASKEVEYTSSLTDIPVVPSITGYTGKWCIYDGSNYVDAVFSNIEGDMDVYAIYAANQYTSTFKVFGQVIDTITQTYGSNIIITNLVPSATDYVFAGWYYNDTRLDSDDMYLYPQNIEIVAKMAYGTLDAPTITYNSSTKIISWNLIEYASYYDIYVSGQLLSRIAGSTTSYKLDSLGVGYFEIYVQAIGNADFCDSDYSNIIEIINETTENAISVNQSNIVYNNGVSIALDIVEDTYTLGWTEDNEVESYIVFVKTNDSFNAYSTTLNNICIYDIVDDSDVSAIRVGAKYAGISSIYMADDICYYNPVQIDGFNNEIYLFDGMIQDHYITSQDELDNVAYYSYIYRQDEVTVVLDTAYISTIMTLYGMNATNSIVEALNAALDSFSETMYYSIGYSLTSDDNYYYLTIENDFYDVYECDISVNCYDYYTQCNYDAYYEIFDGTPRSSTYNSFYSDNQYLYTLVTTTEELYWAVENGIAPVFANANGRPYYIYNKAKEVLNTIIFEEMTDYEKALAIFDWISLNTVYNYTSVSTYRSLGLNGYSDIPSYYLEGVFLNGYAVCDGFSKAFSLLCNMEGIDAIRITGDAGSPGNTGGHAWNKVIIDDECYVVDITWTEFIRSSSTENMSHEYFMVSDEYIATSHYPYSEREKFFLDKYNASGNHMSFYENVEYSYKSNAYNYLISSDAELQSILDYVLDDSRKTVEIMFDYDYMLVLTGGLSVPSSSITTFINNYLNPKISQLMFDQYHVEIASTYEYIVYNSNGDYGLFYVMEFYVMINEISDIEAIISNRSGTDCHYDLVISISLLTENNYAYISGSSLYPTSGYSDLLTAIRAFIADNLTDTYDYSIGNNGHYAGSYCYLTITF